MVSAKKIATCIALTASVVVGTVSAAVGTTQSSRGPHWPTFPAFTKHVTLTWWSWISDTAPLITAFEKAYPTIHIVHYQVPGSEYPKLTAVLKAGSGAPDVAQVEYQYLPQYVATGDLVNLSTYDQQYMQYYPASVKSMVTFNAKLYAMPEDIGPMGLMVQPAVFQKLHLAVPTTWAQYATDAAAIHKADPSVSMTFFSPNDGEIFTGLLWQAGATPFQQTSSGAWKIDFTSPTAEKVAQYWGTLIKSGAIDIINDYTPQWGTDIAKGNFASIIGAAWGPEYVLSPYLTKAQDNVWKVVPLPQWDPAQPADANDGGESMVVTSQSKNPQAAALFAAWLGVAQQALPIQTTAGGLFMSTVNEQYVSAFKVPEPVLGGQDSNLVFEKAVPEIGSAFQWSPWTGFVYGQMQVDLGKAAAGQESWGAALAALQQSVVQFAKTEGYTVQG